MYKGFNRTTLQQPRFLRGPRFGLLTTTFLLLQTFTLGTEGRFLAVTVGGLRHVRGSVRGAGNGVTRLRGRLQRLRTTGARRRGLRVIRLIHNLGVAPRRFTTFIHNNTLRTTPIPVPRFRRRSDTRRRVWAIPRFSTNYNHYTLRNSRSHCHLHQKH